MSKVNKNSQFGTKSWFYGSKNDDKVPKSHVGRRDFRTILAYIRPFFGHLCTPRMTFGVPVVHFWWIMTISVKRIGKKSQKRPIFLKNVQTRLSQNVLLLKILGTQLEIPPTVLKISPQIFLEVFTKSSGYNRMKPDFWFFALKIFGAPKSGQKMVQKVVRKPL